MLIVTIDSKWNLMCARPIAKVPTQWMNEWILRSAEYFVRMCERKHLLKFDSVPSVPSCQLLTTSPKINRNWYFCHLMYFFPSHSKFHICFVKLDFISALLFRRVNWYKRNFYLIDFYSMNCAVFVICLLAFLLHSILNLSVMLLFYFALKRLKHAMQIP